MKWTNDYIGIPYLRCGRTKEGADCYGLVRLVLVKVFGKAIPEYADYLTLSIQDQKRIIDERIPVIDASPTESPAEGDLILFRLCGIPCHIGIYAGNGEFLHTLAPHDSCIERVDSMKWRTRIEGFYRV